MSQETTRDEIRATVVRVLAAIAPEVDAAAIDPHVDWRDQLDLDSVDLLNFVIGIDRALGVDIPEEDYPKLSSLDRCVDYLAARLVARRQP
jgi:acyl carrier protein